MNPPTRCETAHARVDIGRPRGQALKPGQGLKQLYLNDNYITDKGAAFLAEALSRNSTVEELYLQYTSIGDRGLQHFLETMLPKNKTLRVRRTGFDPRAFCWAAATPTASPYVGRLTV